MSATAAAAQRLGRFELLRELGSGAQGTVHLARDTRLGRLVALKTLALPSGRPGEHAQLLRMFLDEARIVGALQHPNLVTLYDAGEQAGAPYLVFEYVEGRSLAEALRADGPLGSAQACSIALGTLRGLACAHAAQILHRDIKPGNIMLAAGPTARLMDFGIACQGGAPRSPDGAVAGTPSYMAPEYIVDGTYVPASDVFAMGVVLYEMLTGRPPAKGADPYATLELIVKQPFVPPSRAGAPTDERLDALVMRALAKHPADRFEDAARMADALEAYMSPAPAAVAGNAAGGTLEFLLRRMRHQSDFPALADTVSAINRITVSDREPVSVLCNAILKDVSLTSKLLKLVNAAHFKQCAGGEISTVSRAIGVLGFDNVRNATMSVLLLDHLQNKAQASRLKEEVGSSYFSGILARELVAKLGVRNAEEAFICAMFHRLGRLLVAFYLVEESEAIERLAQAKGWPDSRAAHEVLGMGYDEIGAGVARSWNFPESIVASMTPVATEVGSRAAFEAERLRVIASLASELCDAARGATPEARAGQISALVRKYGRAVGVSERNLAPVLKSSFQALARDSVVFGAGAAMAPVLAHATNWEEPGENAPPAEETTRTLVDIAQLRETASVDRAAVLSAGVQEITQVLAGDYKLNDLLRAILETMYRAIGFKRVLLCIRDASRNALVARFGLGDDADALVRSGFEVPLDGTPDIFSAATTQGADLCIEDLSASAIRAHVPAWYRKADPARGLVLFPIVLRGRAVGLIYADADVPESLRFKPEELNLLRTLRNQAVLAFRQAT